MTFTRLAMRTSKPVRSPTISLSQTNIQVPALLPRRIPGCLFDLNQMEGHEFLVKIAITQLQRAAFQAVSLEAERDKEMAGLSAGEHNTQVDLFELGQRLGMGNRSL